jgi:hypothetical protein
MLQTLKQSLNVLALKSFLTKRHGNAGRERYRRASLTASASFISCGLERADVLAYSLSLCAVCTIGLGIVFARWWGVGGVGLAMALSKIFTSSPIQLYKIRGILRANRAPTLVHEQLAVA